MYRAGTINAKTFVCLDGSLTWQEVSAIEHKFAGPTSHLAPPPKPIRLVDTDEFDKPSKKGNPALGCLVLLVLLAAIGFFVWAVFFQHTSEPLAEVPVTNLEWPPFQELYGSKSKLTDLQKDNEWKNYKGQRVRWTGTLVAVQDDISGFTMQVKMDPDTLTSDFLIYLRPSEKDKALGLVKGAPVTFTATFDSWGNIMPTTMTDGVIDN